MAVEEKVVCSLTSHTHLPLLASISMHFVRNVLIQMVNLASRYPENKLICSHFK